MHIIPKGSKTIAGGKRSATTGYGRRVSVDPEGIADAQTTIIPNSVIPSGSNTRSASIPVVALRLPPAIVFKTAPR